MPIVAALTHGAAAKVDEQVQPAGCRVPELRGPHPLAAQGLPLHQGWLDGHCSSVHRARILSACIYTCRDSGADVGTQGIYYQAEIHGQTVTWIVPYKFNQHVGHVMRCATLTAAAGRRGGLHGDGHVPAVLHGADGLCQLPPLPVARHQVPAQGMCR